LTELTKVFDAVADLQAAVSSIAQLIPFKVKKTIIILHGIETGNINRK
jgi:hypothetical protein